jgi:hypothetical protein
VPQAFGRVVIGQFGEIEAGGEVIADAVDHDRADAVGEASEAIADRKDNAVIERVALGWAIEADREHRASLLDLEQGGWSGGGVCHGIIMS